MENCMVVSQKVAGSTILSSSSSASGIMSKGNENAMLKRYLHPIYRSIIDKSHDMKTT